MTSPRGADAGRLAVRVLPDTSVFARSLLRYLERIEARTVLRIRTEVDGAALTDSVRDAVRVAERTAAVRLTTDLDSAAVVPEVRRVAAVASRSARVRVGVDLDGADVALAVAGLAKVVATGSAVAGTVASAIPQVLALGSALAATAPAAAVAVPALAAVLAIAGTMGLALHGVTDALSAAASGDAERYAAALAKLSPAARTFVGEAAQLMPTLRQIRSAVQEAFFARLGDNALTRVSDNLLPTLRAGLTGIADGAGLAARNVAAFLASGTARSSLGVLVDGIRGSLAALTRAPAQLVQVLAQLGAAATPALRRLSAGLAGVLDRFTAAVDRSARSGALTVLIDRALDTLAQLGRIAGNVARIIGALFSAGDDGAGLLDTIERITSAVARFAASSQGQAVLGRFLDLLAEAGPVLLIASGLASAVTAVASALAALATPSGAVVVVLAALAAGLLLAYRRVGPFRDVVRSTFSALAQIVAGSAATIVGWISGRLVPALAELGSRTAPLLREFAALWQERVLPAIVAVAGAYQAQLQPTLDRITRVIADKVTPAVDSLTAAYLRNKPQIDQLVGAVAGAVSWLGQLSALVAGPTVRALIALGGVILSHGITNLGRLIDVLGASVRAFNAARSAAGQLGSGVASATNTAVSWLGGLPARIDAVFGGAQAWLFGAGRNIVQGLINGIWSMMQNAVNAIRALGNKLIDTAGDVLHLGSPSRVFADIGRQTVAGFVVGVESARPQAQRAMTRLLSPPRPPGIEPAPPGGTNGTPVYVVAQIGDRPVTEMVEATVTGNPEKFAHAIRIGERSLARRG